MDAERWQRVSQLFEAVLECPAAERAAFLAAACEGNDALRRDVESLLAQEERNGPLDRPVFVAEDPLPATAALTEGSSVGPYRIAGIIGAGGMGEVYRAHDSKLGRQVALKVLPPQFAADP